MLTVSYIYKRDCCYVFKCLNERLIYNVFLCYRSYRLSVRLMLAVNITLPPCLALA